VRASEILFGGSLEGITEAQFDEVIAEVPNVTLPLSLLSQSENAFIDYLLAAALSPRRGRHARISNSEAST